GLYRTRPEGISFAYSPRATTKSSPLPRLCKRRAIATTTSEWAERSATLHTYATSAGGSRRHAWSLSGSFDARAEGHSALPVFGSTSELLGTKRRRRERIELAREASTVGGAWPSSHSSAESAPATLWRLSATRALDSRAGRGGECLPPSPAQKRARTTRPSGGF